MTIEQVQKLRELSGKLETFLAQMNQPDLLTSSEELAELLKSVVEAGEWIQDSSLPAMEPGSETVLPTYRLLLERLRGVLPLLEVRLRMERARLGSERSQLTSASQWSSATKETISSR